MQTSLILWLLTYAAARVIRMRMINDMIDDDSGYNDEDINFLFTGAKEKVFFCGCAPMLLPR